jgi:hypothetical protein
MKRYRKKPIEVEVQRWTGQNHIQMYNFLESQSANYDKDIKDQGANFYIDHFKVSGGLVIKTLEGEHKASIGDYIIKGIKGEFYPCKPEIFEQTYEEVQGE